MAKITKADIIDTIYEKSEMERKDIHSMLDFFLEEIKNALVSDKIIELRGFGTFEVKKRKGRIKARNPKTGESLTVDPHGVVFFRAGRDLKNDVYKLKPGNE